MSKYIACLLVVLTMFISSGTVYAQDEAPAVEDVTLNMYVRLCLDFNCNNWFGDTSTFLKLTNKRNGEVRSSFGTLVTEPAWPTVPDRVEYTLTFDEIPFGSRFDVEIRYNCGNVFKTVSSPYLVYDYHVIFEVQKVSYCKIGLTNIY